MTVTLIFFSVILGIAFYMGLSDFQHYTVIPLSADEQIKYANHNARALVVYPLFTDFAYRPHGFYDYYSGKCDTKCLTIHVIPDRHPKYTTGENTYEMLRKLNYTILNDAYLDQHPEEFAKYDRIIFLHEEYVTKNLFNMFSQKNHTMYLYPNSLYAYVSMNYTTGNMTLLKGHGYMSNETGIGWKYEFGTINEYDIKCDSYKFIKLGNQGVMLSCYPELLIQHNRDLLRYIKDFTNGPL